MTASLETIASGSLKQNGKTFWLASLFLPADIAADATLLYAFCRKMDDLADLGGGLDAAERLDRVSKELQTGWSDEPTVLAFIQLRERRGLDCRAAAYLLDVLIRDASGSVRIQDEAELLRYCYGAAGTVGLMMAGVLGVHAAAAEVNAIDLGIAMQLTNIARDVQEDARNGRRYLPATWVDDLSPEQIVAVTPDAETLRRIAQAIERILALADVFYANGARGFPAIPPKARSGIRIAAAAYRHIGVKLRRRGCDFRAGRVVVSLPSKVSIAAAVLCGSSDLERLTCSEDVAGFHAVFDGYPGFQ